MPQIILYEWKIIFSGSLLHKTPTPWEYGYSLIVESKEYANICNTIYCCNVSSMQSNKTVLYMFRITTSEVYRTIDALLQFLHVTH